MPDYTLTTKSSWSKTLNELESSLYKWGATEIDVNYPRGARSEKSDQSADERTVILQYMLKGKDVKVEMGRQLRAVDNLRVLYICIESMRMNERRGMSETMESMYLQLASPVQEKSPWEILGIMPDSPIEVAEAVYRTMAIKYHPDKGGNPEMMRLLNSAIERIRKGNE